VNQTLQQKRWSLFSCCELSIYVWQYSYSVCVWSIYFSVDAIFNCLYFRLSSPKYRIAANKGSYVEGFTVVIMTW